MNADLLPIATKARSFLERVWPIWHKAMGSKPAVISSGTCGRSSLFLQRVLKDDHGVASTWVTGKFMNAGNPERHSWLKVGGQIIDITADQFGLDPIIVVPANDERYIPGDDTATPDFRAKRERNVTAIWPDWCRMRGK